MGASLGADHDAVDGEVIPALGGQRLLKQMNRLGPERGADSVVPPYEATSSSSSFSASSGSETSTAMSRV